MPRFRLIPLVLLMACSAALFAADKPRVYVTDSKSWEISGGIGGAGDAFGGGAKGGDRPQTAEIIKTFHERCPSVTINNIRDKADYVILLDHEGGKDLIRRDNKVAVFNREGDAILSSSTRSLGNAVKDVCGAITQDWASAGSRSRIGQTTDAFQSPAPTGSVATETLTTASTTRVQINSDPPGGEIEVDGNFVGHTPSSVELAPGEHQIAIHKPGYKPWSRKMTALGGRILLAAELQAEERAELRK